MKIHRKKEARYERVFLVSPPSSSYLGAARPPQNIGYLAESLLKSGIDYRIMDMRLGYQFKDLLKQIKRYNPDLIGFTLVSLEYLKSYALIDQVKQHFPSADIIAGGPHVTVLQDAVLEECASIDYGIVHEGEASLVEVCRSKTPVHQIRGLIWRKNGADIIFNGHRETNPNLDHIPYPTYKGFELNRYIREIPLNSSRGCPYQCVFCPNKMITKQFRWRSAEHVVDEIAYWYKEGYRVFNFDDDNMSLKRERILELCSRIEERGLDDAEFRCSNGIRADRVDYDLLKRMHEVGFQYIAFGVDGGNNRMLQFNKKGESIEQIETAVRNACNIGYDVKIFCILGMPHETKEDVEDSFRFMQKFPVRRIILNNPIPYPGTELFEIVKANKWFVKSPEYYLNHITENANEPVFITPELNFETRKQVLKRARKIEKRITRRAVRAMYQKIFPINHLLALLFATDFIENLFFRNHRFRQMIENIRYKRGQSRRNTG
jgi:anaerobic magnesium-protoporphyrin IX monomethyl ester cyclase